MFKFLRNRRGQGMVEYILIVVVVVGVVLGAYKLFGTKIGGTFTKAADRIDSERDSFGTVTTTERVEYDN
ncbi:MAG: hypothetical protein FWG57_07030 [Endomicrobia bacterium]|nr:hypothetical protein [Endomicrobiia bacterium]